MSKFTVTTMDDKSRVSIINDIDTNIFVEAGAGSGKTAMLVNRMVSMVEKGKPVEKICAITFTKNAALEFYERFEAKLIERSNPLNSKEAEYAGDLEAPTEITRERCAKALENIDLCFMGTIDSFCNMILSEHPTEANIPFDARIINDEEAKEIYKEFYVSVRKGAYGKELKELSDRFNMFFWGAEDIFASLISEIMDRRNVTFHYDDKLCIDFFKCFSKQRDDVKEALNIFEKDLSKLILPVKDDEDYIDIFKEHAATLQKGWNYNYKGVEIALNAIKDLNYEGSSKELGLDSNSIIRDVEGAAKVGLNINDLENKNALIIKLQDYKYQNTLKFLLSCIKPLEELMKKDGKFSFFDYLLYLRDMLVEDSKKEGKLIDYIYNRHSYFLIDEFQDTNPMQAEVFFYLAAKDPKQKSWKDCKPKDGSLFIVGDPKQSIYRFRSADVSSYLKIKELFNNNKENSEVKYLVNNFRSKNSIKQYVNDVFSIKMSEESEDQSKYRDIKNISFKEEDEFNGIFKYTCYGGRSLIDNPDMEDSIQIGQIIKTIINSDKQIIERNKQDEDYGKLRRIKYSDFMVIFYNKKGISRCIEVFKQMKIPSRVEGKVLFDQAEGLRTLTSIYKTITTINDTISLVETLKTPVFGFNDNDLSDYRNTGNDIKLDLTKNYSNIGIDEALKKLVSSSLMISSQTPSSLFEVIMDDYELFKYVSSDSLEVVYYVLELIRNEEHSGNIVNYEDAVNYMDNLINNESDLERCLSLKQNVDAVHIANLHKVKGLEAPIVILAKAGTNKNIKAGIRIEYNDDTKTNKTLVNGFVCSLKDPNNKNFNAIETKALSDSGDKEVNSLKNEVDRLIYVAATRARNVLIINDTHQKVGRSTKVSSSGKNNQWHYLLEQTKDNIFDVIQKDLKEPNNTNSLKAIDLYKNVDLTKFDFTKTYEYKKPSDIKETSKIVESPINDNSEDTSYNYDARLTGTIIHRLMEMIIMSKDNIEKDVLVKNILDEYINVSAIDNKDNYKKMLESVFDVMHNGGYVQKGNIDQDILPIILSSNNVYSEVPFSYLDDNNNLWNGIIDLIYEKDGKLHIIDWKTNKDDSNLDEHYKDQLEAYKKAVKVILNKDVHDALIYHIDINTKR